MSLDVENKQRTLFILNLPAGFISDHPDLQPTRMTHAQEAVTPDGTPGVRYVDRELPASMTWLPGELKSGLPFELSLIPEFKSAVNERRLRVIERSEPSPPPPVPGHDEPKHAEGESR